MLKVVKLLNQVYATKNDKSKPGICIPQVLEQCYSHVDS